MNISKDIQKHIDSVAGKLLADGLTPSRYTKKEAKRLTKNVVAVNFVHKLIDGFSPEIKKAMQRIKK